DSQFYDQVAQQVVSHRARWRNLLNLERNCIRFVRANPDRQHRIALHVFENYYWGTAVGIHHQRPDLYFYFHTRYLNPVPNSLADSTVEAVKLRFRNKYVNYFPLSVASAVEVHDFVTGRVSRHVLRGPGTWPFSQHTHCSTNIIVVNLFLNQSLHPFKLHKAFGLFSERQIILEL